MKIKSFGCSFIFGSELPDTLTRDFGPSDMTWPAIIAQTQGWSHQCYAWPGRGNLYIADRVLEQAQQSNYEDIFIINWTWVDRFDYFDAADDAWNSVLPRDRGKIPDCYHRYLHSQKRDKLVSLMYIHACLCVLDQRQIPFVMTYMDELLTETRWHTDPAIESLQSLVLPRLQDFQGRDFLSWSRHQGYPVSDLWHPLQQAHAAAAEIQLPLVLDMLHR